ncbi:MAG: hypothetical protein ABR576_17100 [Thermoanaerobaculia bacterium]
MRKRQAELLGFHGLVLGSSEPEALARRWRDWTGLPVLRRSRREIVLGHGPELFVTIRRLRRGQPDRVEEAHLAVKELAATRRRGDPDPLGGDSWRRPAGPLDLVVRELARPPAASWRKKRKPVTG